MLTSRESLLSELEFNFVPKIFVTLVKRNGLRLLTIDRSEVRNLSLSKRGYVRNRSCEKEFSLHNPLSPNNHKQILQTGLHTFR